MLHNRRRDASGTMEGFDHAYEDDLTDLKVSEALSSPWTPADLIARIRSSDTFFEWRRESRQRDADFLENMYIATVRLETTVLLPLA